MRLGTASVALPRNRALTEVSFVTIMPGLPQAKILDSLRLFAQEVMSRYR
ncbi:MAG: hypothetical protein ACREXT_03985 [Gammaproteobacteria bacterium]